MKKQGGGGGGCPRVFPSYPLSFQTLAHSFARGKNSTLLFSIASALFAKNHPGWGERGLSVFCLKTLRRSDVKTLWTVLSLRNNFPIARVAAATTSCAPTEGAPNL